jgi:hypothetical protein
MPVTIKMMHGTPLLTGPVSFFFPRIGLNFAIDAVPSRRP